MRLLLLVHQDAHIPGVTRCFERVDGVVVGYPLPPCRRLLLLLDADSADAEDHGEDERTHHDCPDSKHYRRHAKNSPVAPVVRSGRWADTMVTAMVRTIWDVAATATATMITVVSR